MAFHPGWSKRLLGGHGGAGWMIREHVKMLVGWGIHSQSATGCQVIMVMTKERRSWFKFQVVVYSMWKDF